MAAMELCMTLVMTVKVCNYMAGNLSPILVCFSGKMPSMLLRKFI